MEQLLHIKHLTYPKRIELVRDDLLPGRVRKWVERLAWTALTLQHGEEDEPWQEFFISARELHAGREIGEIPLMTHVAANSVNAFMASHPNKWDSPAARQ